MSFAIWIIFVQGLFWSAILVLLIYLVIRRVKISREEDFEKRDN